MMFFGIEVGGVRVWVLGGVLGSGSILAGLSLVSFGPVAWNHSKAPGVGKEGWLSRGAEEVGVVWACALRWDGLSSRSRAVFRP